MYSKQDTPQSDTAKIGSKHQNKAVIIITQSILTLEKPYYFSESESLETQLTSFFNFCIREHTKLIPEEINFDTIDIDALNKYIESLQQLKLILKNTSSDKQETAKIRQVLAEQQHFFYHNQKKTIASIKSHLTESHLQEIIPKDEDLQSYLHLQKKDSYLHANLGIRKKMFIEKINLKIAEAQQALQEKIDAQKSTEQVDETNTDILNIQTPESPKPPESQKPEDIEIIDDNPNILASHYFKLFMLLLIAIAITASILAYIYLSIPSFIMVTTHAAIAATIAGLGFWNSHKQNPIKLSKTPPEEDSNELVIDFGEPYIQNP